MDNGKTTDQERVPENDQHSRLSPGVGEKFRTHLNAIIGFSELVDLQSLTPNVKSDVQHILKAARDLLAIVNQEFGDQTDKERDNDNTVAEPFDILYIEDDLANFTLVERILEFRPWLTLKHATTGRMGLEAALLGHPRLILLDLNLPDIQGAEVLQLLRDTPDTAAIPVVILSANVASSHLERLLAAGAQNYLTKPFDIDPFLAIVDEFAGEKPTAPRHC